MTDSPILAATRRVDAADAIEHKDAHLGALAINATLEAMDVLHGRRRMLAGDFRTSRGILSVLMNLPAARVTDGDADQSPRAPSVPNQILDDMEEALKIKAAEVGQQRVA